MSIHMSVHSVLVRLVLAASLGLSAGVMVYVSFVEIFRVKAIEVRVQTCVQT